MKPEDARKRRVVENEALFREVNERVSDLDAGFGRSAVIATVCECGDAGCFDRIDMPHAEYEALRADPATFAIVPGHDDPAVEEVVAERDGYHVVRKYIEAGGRFAAEHDPRGGRDEQ
jgi:hypothetical protein